MGSIWVMVGEVLNSSTATEIGVSMDNSLQADVVMILIPSRIRVRVFMSLSNFITNPANE
jgi:hypothetical protein